MTRDGDGDGAWCVAGAQATARDARGVTYAAFEASAGAIAVYVARKGANHASQSRHRDDDDDDDATTRTATALTLDVEKTRRRVRAERGYELARTTTEMMARTKRAFERDDVAVAATTATPRRSATTTTTMRAWTDEGESDGDAVEIEWVEREEGEGTEGTYVEALERIVEAFARASERTKREREAKRRRDEGTGEDERRSRSASATPKASPAKGTSVGKWMSEATRTRPKLKAVAERERLNEETNR